jgi:nicotinamide mononucleotide transporter
MHTWTDAALPWLDAMLAALSLVAQWWQARRHIATWWLWIIVDVVYVGMYLVKSLDVTAGLYLVFVGLAVMGLRAWTAADEAPGAMQRR